jgi:hypothetical protein
VIDKHRRIDDGFETWLSNRMFIDADGSRQGILPFPLIEFELSVGGFINRIRRASVSSLNRLQI